MNINKILVQTNKIYAESKCRWGQALFSSLWENEPEFSRHIIGTQADPFHAMTPEDPRCVECFRLMQEQEEC